jgi:hypothetical protein
MAEAASAATWAERRAGQRSIWVSDDLFDAPLVKIVHRLVAALPHYRADYDTEASSDVLHLKHEWRLDELGENPAIRAIRDPIVAAIEQRYGQYQPELKRVHANDQAFGDILTAHTDLQPGVTAIYYVNEVWEQAWDGETLFYACGEAVTAVAPRPGRVILFPADIVHRSGAPSRVCRTTRRTIAFKFKTAAPVP